MQYSYDGIEFSSKIHHLGLFNKLLKERYKKVVNDRDSYHRLFQEYYGKYNRLYSCYKDIERRLEETEKFLFKFNKQWYENKQKKEKIKLFFHLSLIKRHHF